MTTRARQADRNTLISDHAISDIGPVRAAVPTCNLVVRTDPWPHAATQVDAAIGAGADALMLPMVRTAEAVEAFVGAVAGRAGVVLLLETAEALANLSELLSVTGLDHVHVGLNDLHRDLGRRFMFELVADGTVERIGTEVLAAGLSFGFGGVGRIGGGPLPPELILSEHLRIGSSQVILSRDFAQVFKKPDAATAISREVHALRSAIARLAALPPEDRQRQTTLLRQTITEIATLHTVR